MGVSFADLQAAIAANAARRGALNDGLQSSIDMNNGDLAAMAGTGGVVNNEQAAAMQRMLAQQSQLGSQRTAMQVNPLAQQAAPRPAAPVAAAGTDYMAGLKAMLTDTGGANVPGMLPHISLPQPAVAAPEMAPAPAPQVDVADLPPVGVPAAAPARGLPRKGRAAPVAKSTPSSTQQLQDDNNFVRTAIAGNFKAGLPLNTGIEGFIPNRPAAAPSISDVTALRNKATVVNRAAGLPLNYGMGN